MKEMKMSKLGYRRKRRKRKRRMRRMKRSYRFREREEVLVSSKSSFTLNDVNQNSPVTKISNLLLTLIKNSTSSEAEQKWGSTYKRMNELNKNLEISRKSTLDTYSKKVYDLVLEDGMKKENKRIEIPTIKSSHPLIQSGINLINSFSGTKNQWSARILSPKIAPLSFDGRRERGILSPSIFPFYKDDVEQQILPIPDILDKSGLKKSEKDKLMSLIMEISRTRNVIDEAMKMISIINGGSIEKDPVSKAVLTATDKMSNDFEKLETSLNVDQRSELQKFGFSMLEMSQMVDLFTGYGASDVLNKTEMIEYGKYTKEERMLALWKSIENIAFGKYSDNTRKKRQITTKVGGVTIFTYLVPTILSPYMFSPVYGLVVLGPVILSPNLFSPLILDPAVLSPWIFSPAFPLPFILSPYVLSPYIFSPLVMAPFILNPYVLSPNIFNNYVLSPLILSPLVLCPDVFSPMVLGGAILSPGVLSPSVLSKSYLMANVLSPTILSKK